MDPWPVYTWPPHPPTSKDEQGRPCWVLHPEKTLETSCPLQQGWAPHVAQTLLIIALSIPGCSRKSNTKPRMSPCYSQQNQVRETNSRSMEEGRIGTSASKTSLCFRVVWLCLGLVGLFFYGRKQLSYRQVSCERSSEDPLDAAGLQRGLNLAKLFQITS